MSITSKTRYIEWHEPCKCKCVLDASVCNNKQRWNEDNCRCECKKLIDKGTCDKGLIWNPTNCECKCNKSCDVGEYLDYKDCKCRNKLVDKLVEKCNENIDGNEMIYNETINVSSSDYKCGSCTLYIVLFVVFLVTSVIINAVFVYFYWYSKDSNDQMFLY